MLTLRATAWACPLSDGRAEEVDELERPWPCGKETDAVSQNSSANWREYRFGRIPSFVWKDRGPNYSTMQENALQTEERDQRNSPLMTNMLRDDAHTYERHFAPAAGPLRRRPYRDSETVQRRPRNGSENLEAGSSLEGRQAKRPNGFHGHRGMVYGHARSDILHACGRSKRVGPSSHDSNL